jgi:hypothetical protein
VQISTWSQGRKHASRGRIVVGALVLGVGVAGCGGDGGSSSPEEEVKDTVAQFLEYAIDGENGRACALTTDTETCLSGLLLAGGFLGEGGLEAVLGEDWRAQLENAEVTFADDDHASVPPLTPEEESPTELVREDGEWLIVVEEEGER